jgi:hypothetical protein
MTKQNFTAFVSGIILGVIIPLSINPRTYVDENMEREVRRLRISEDSLKNVVKISGDNLKITEERIKILQLERDSLAVIANSKQKIYEKVVFRNFTDAQRDSILSELYPSFRPVR